MTTATLINKTVDAVIRDGDTFKVRYQIVTAVENQYAHPVYTGNLKANGTIAKSRTLKHLATVAQQRVSDAIEEVSKDVAEMIYNSGKFTQPQRNSNGWVVYAI